MLFALDGSYHFKQMHQHTHTHSDTGKYVKIHLNSVQIYSIKHCWLNLSQPEISFVKAKKKFKLQFDEVAYITFHIIFYTNSEFPYFFSVHEIQREKTAGGENMNLFQKIMWNHLSVNVGHSTSAFEFM